jgi:hypothetical protein
MQVGLAAPIWQCVPGQQSALVAHCPPEPLQQMALPF